MGGTRNFCEIHRDQIPPFYRISATFIQSQSWNSSEKYPPMNLKKIASFIFKDSVVDYFQSISKINKLTKQFVLYAFRQYLYMAQSWNISGKYPPMNLKNIHYTILYFKCQIKKKKDPSCLCFTNPLFIFQKLNFSSAFFTSESTFFICIFSQYLEFSSSASDKTH